MDSDWQDVPAHDVTSSAPDRPAFMVDAGGHESDCDPGVDTRSARGVQKQEMAFIEVERTGVNGARTTSSVMMYTAHASPADMDFRNIIDVTG